jgi:hypothetical protein
MPTWQPYQELVWVVVKQREQTLVGGRIFVLPVLQEFEEFLRTALFKKTHQWAFDCLHLGAGNLRDLAVTIDETARDLLEFEITCDIRVHEDLREFSGCYDKLRDEIDGIIPVTTKLTGRSLITTEFSIKLLIETRSETAGYIMLAADLSKVQTGTVPAIIVIPVHMEDLLALHRKKAR